MYHASNYKSKTVMTAFSKQMETLLVTSGSEFQDMDLYTFKLSMMWTLVALFCIMYMYLIISIVLPYLTCPMRRGQNGDLSKKF